MLCRCLRILIIHLETSKIMHFFFLTFNKESHKHYTDPCLLVYGTKLHLEAIIHMFVEEINCLRISKPKARKYRIFLIVKIFQNIFIFVHDNKVTETKLPHHHLLQHHRSLNTIVEFHTQVY